VGSLRPTARPPDRPPDRPTARPPDRPRPPATARDRPTARGQGSRSQSRPGTTIAALLGADEIADHLGGLFGYFIPENILQNIFGMSPIDGSTEVWAAGVTYDRSRSARQEERAVSSVYELVYEADRSELFDKSAAWRVVTDGEPADIRLGSGLDVPEAELALVLSAEGRIVGDTVRSDMSSRSIEGENPLYLSQAKVYAGSCALATGIRPASEVADAADLTIELRVKRDGRTAWGGTTSTVAVRRDFEDLARSLFAGQSFPTGVAWPPGPVSSRRRTFRWSPARPSGSGSTRSGPSRTRPAPGRPRSAGWSRRSTTRSPAKQVGSPTAAGERAPEPM